MANEKGVYSLDPIDCGFDPRAHGMNCELPADTTGVVYTDRPGRRLLVRGSKAWMQRKLREAGYRVRWAS